MNHEITNKFFPTIVDTFQGLRAIIDHWPVILKKYKLLFKKIAGQLSLITQEPFVNIFYTPQNILWAKNRVLTHKM